MTTTLPRTCSCGRPARTDNDSGVCHQWPICGLDEILPPAATRYTSQTAPTTKDPR